MESKEIDNIEDLLTAVYIQTSRLYDVMMTLLGLQNEQAALELATRHEQGILIGPAPALKGTDDGQE